MEWTIVEALSSVTVILVLHTYGFSKEYLYLLAYPVCEWWLDYNWGFRSKIATIAVSLVVTVVTWLVIDPLCQWMIKRMIYGSVLSEIDRFEDLRKQQLRVIVKAMVGKCAGYCAIATSACRFSSVPWPDDWVPHSPSPSSEQGSSTHWPDDWVPHSLSPSSEQGSSTHEKPVAKNPALLPRPLGGEKVASETTKNHKQLPGQKSPKRIRVRNLCTYFYHDHPSCRPSVKLEWDPPEYGDIVHYHIRHWEKSGPIPPPDASCTSVSGTSQEKILGLKSLGTYVFQVRAEGRDGQFGGWAGVEWHILGGECVRNLRTCINRDQHSCRPLVTLVWDPPGNCTKYGDVVRYDIRYWEKSGPATCGTPPPGASCTSTSVSGTSQQKMFGKTDLKSLGTYVFQVRAEGRDGQFGGWAGVECDLDWLCRYPCCTKKRLQLDGSNDNMYDFCCRGHKRLFDSQYCLYPGCTQRKPDAYQLNTSTPRWKHFCVDHYTNAKNTGMAILVCLASVFCLGTITEIEHKSIVQMFEKTWNNAKGPCPRVRTILSIVNPSVEAKFQLYRRSLPYQHQKTERYFHGTKLKCRINDYHVMCSTPGCSVCGIVKKGFVSERMNPKRWQRFGQAFYFAPNSSKAHDYCGQQPAPHTYWGMFLCDVAPGRKYTLRPRKDTEEVPKVPPEGYNSLYGKSKSFLRRSDLNYDELAVFNEDAISPQYLILYSQ